MKSRDIHATRDVILGDQYNADLTRLESQLDQIIQLLSMPQTNIQVGGDVHDSILLIGDGNQIQLQRADLERLSRLQNGADTVRREQLYLMRFILGEAYARWERFYLPLAGQLLEPALRLSDRSDDGLSQAGVHLGDIRQAITRYGKTRLVILGEPGCGKTTTINRLSLDLARERLHDPLNAHLPVRVDLFKFTDERQPGDFLHSEWDKTGLFLDYGEAISAGQVCFLLDGVNQMPIIDRAKRVERWAHWANHDLPNGNWAVFTCRTADYISSLRLPEIQVSALDDEQVRKYFELRFGSERGQHHWVEVEKRLRANSDRFGRLARNPFMLNLMADNLTENKSFAESRALLMQDLADRLLDRELQSGRQSDTLIADPKGTRDALLEALSRLAFAMQRRGEGTGLTHQLIEKTPLSVRRGMHLSVSDVLGLALDATLLEETELTDEKGHAQSGYAFYHHLLQEYFAALSLLADFRAGKDITSYARVPWQVWQFLWPHLPKTRRMPPPPVTGWEETITFAAVLAGRDAQKLVEQIVKVNLPLAGRCLAEIGEKRQDLYTFAEQTRAALLTRQRNRQAHIRSRIDAGLALGELGHPDLRPQSFEFEGKEVWAIIQPMQEVPAGEFIFGSDINDKDAYENEKIAKRHFSLPQFSIGRYTVTNAEFHFFLEAKGYHDDRWWGTEGRRWKQGGSQAHADAIESWMERLNRIKNIGLQKSAMQFGWQPASKRFWAEIVALDESVARERAHNLFIRPFDRPAYWEDARFVSPARPVVGINWYEASAYCLWLSTITGRNFCLPNELEWEKAARGLNGGVWPWGDQFNSAHCNTADARIYRTVPVGLYPKGVSPFGLWETAGNVSEWTNSWYQMYPNSIAAQDNDFGERYRVVRGGSWLYLHRGARCAYRNKMPPLDFSYSIGFRYVSH